VIMPSFGWNVTRLAAEYDVVLIHLPQFDAPGVAARGRLFNKPTVILYHSDLLLPPGLVNRLVNFVIDVMNNLAGLLAHKIVAYTEDFARHASFLNRFAKKVRVILPNIEYTSASPEAIAAFKELHNPQGQKVIGMGTRLAAEKGVETLLEALPAIQERYPHTKVLFAGQYEGVLGEEAYANHLKPLIKRYQDGGCWEFLGVLSMDQMAAFFPNLDVLVVPSLNSTETVSMTGMGKVIPVGDGVSLAKAVLEIFDHPEMFAGEPEKVVEMFHPDTNAAGFEALFQELLEKR
jgi:glycosyltransferase involved in cell wall biosynthesis